MVQEIHHKGAKTQRGGEAFLDWCEGVQSIRPLNREPQGLKPAFIRSVSARLKARPLKAKANLILTGAICVVFTGVVWAADSPNSKKPAIALLNQGRVDEVVASLQGKEDAESHNLKARAYYAEDKSDDAIREAEKSVAMSANNSSYHLWLGRAYGQKAEKVNVLRQAGMAGKVREQFEKSVALDGNNVAARSDLAEFYIDAPGMMGGGTDKAKAQADAVAAREPATGKFIEAKIAEKNKDYPAAEKKYRDAIQASKTPAEQWLNLAAFYKDRKRTKEMMDAVRKAAVAQHKSAAVLNDAAGMLFDAGQDFSLAAELAKKYLAAPDKDEEAPAFKTHLLLGRILEKQGNRDGAVKEYQAALAMAKDYEPAKKALGR